MTSSVKRSLVFSLMVIVAISVQAASTPTRAEVEQRLASVLGGSTSKARVVLRHARSGRSR